MCFCVSIETWQNAGETWIHNRQVHVTFLMQDAHKSERTKVWAQCWTTGAQVPQRNQNLVCHFHTATTVRNSGGTQREMNISRPLWLFLCMTHCDSQFTEPVVRIWLALIFKRSALIVPWNYGWLRIPLSTMDILERIMTYTSNIYWLVRWTVS